MIPNIQINIEVTVACNKLLCSHLEQEVIKIHYVGSLFIGL